MPPEYLTIVWMRTFGLTSALVSRQEAPTLPLIWQDRVVVILTKPEDFIRNPKGDEKFARRIQKKYPVSAENLRQRANRYNQEVAIAKVFRQLGQVLIISPDDTCGVDTLTRNREALRRLYKKGYRDAKKINAFLYRTERE